jgi:hypothetical protein
MEEINVLKEQNMEYCYLSSIELLVSNDDVLVIQPEDIVSFEVKDTYKLAALTIKYFTGFSNLITRLREDKTCLIHIIKSNYMYKEMSITTLGKYYSCSFTDKHMCIMFDIGEVTIGE